MTSDNQNELSSASTSVGMSAWLNKAVRRSPDSATNVVSKVVPSVSFPRMRELWSLISTSSMEQSGSSTHAWTRSSNSS